MRRRLLRSPSSRRLDQRKLRRLYRPARARLHLELQRFEGAEMCGQPRPAFPQAHLQIARAHARSPRNLRGERFPSALVSSLRALRFDLDVDRNRLTDAGHCLDRKSTRLNSSHVAISYAVFCLKKKKQDII